MTQDVAYSAKNIAIADLVLTHTLIGVLLAKKVLSPEEATMVVKRSVDKLNNRPEIAQIISEYFKSELAGSWVERTRLLDETPAGQA